MRVRVAVALRMLVALVAAVLPGEALAALCNAQSCVRQYCTTGAVCDGLDSCAVKESFFCANGQSMGDVACAGTWEPGACGARCDDPAFAPFDTCPQQCAGGMGAPEVCGDGADNDFSGCIDDGCTKGKPPCTCTAGCAVPACSSVPIATCNPYNGGRERCANGIDDNCNGQADEGCPPKSPESCYDKAGADPILLANRSAVTEPFTDFSAESIVRLSLTRTYTSADASLSGGAPYGVFGPGWHHDWEGGLSCDAGVCTVTRGLDGASRFSFSQAASSLDGTQTLEIYRPWHDDVTPPDNTDLLVHRPDGVWILHRMDGRELHFATVCDPCDATGATCRDPLAGGTARLVSVVDEKANMISLGYDRPSGLLLAVADALGHTLEIRGADACGVALATELRFDGATVATYEYDGLALASARDADDRVLRSYVYEAVTGGYLAAVVNEAGAAIAEFSYDGAGNAIGVIDAESSVGVSYESGRVDVTEHYGNGAASTSTRMLDQDGHVTSVSAGCACGSAQTLGWIDKRLACVTDASGKMTYTKRDGLGRVTESVELSATTCPPSSHDVSLAPRRELRAYGVKKPIAQGIELDLDRVTSISRVSSVNQSMWATEAYDYDPTPNAIDPAGYTCTEAPLPSGAVVCRHIKTGYVGPAGSTVRERHATFYSYDARGRVVRTYGPVSIEPSSPTDVVPIEERVHWADMELLQRRGRLMEVRQYSSPTAPPLVTQYDYDAFGVYRTVAPNGGATTIVKDGRGRPSFVIGPDGVRFEMRYYDGLAPRLRIAPSGATVRFSYDGKGRLATSEVLDRDPDAGVATVAWSEHRTHDASGNVTHIERRDGVGAVTWRQDREYDVQHRVVREVHPEDAVVARAFAYDATGFLASITDEEGRATLFTPDVLRRVAKVRRTGFDAQGQPVGLDIATYAFDRQQDSLSEVRDWSSRPTTYSHDDFGRLQEIATESMMNRPLKYKYDVRGNLRQRKSSYFGYSGETIITQVDYAYDGLNRRRSVSARNGSDGAIVSYTFRYDEPGGEGLLTSVVEPDRTIRFSYDLAGRLRRETIEENAVSVPLVTEYEYDADGDLTFITYPSGLRVRYVLDPATKRPVRVENAATGSSYAHTISWLPAGPVASLTFGNGLSLTHTFDARYQPSSISSGPLQLAYAMTPAGDVGSITEAGTTRAMQYDFLDRLTSSPGWLAYGYDGGGNRTTESVGGVSGTYRYSAYAPDRIVEKLAAGNVRQLAFTYDLDTNVSGISRWNGAAGVEGYCLRHDPLGRLDHVGTIHPAWILPDAVRCLTDENISLVTARFKYDFRGRRVARWQVTTGQWTYIVSDAAGNPLSELALSNGAWTKVRDYVWLDGRPLAQVEYPGPGGGAAGYVYYFHLDHIGLPRALTNESQQTVWSAAARPYGDIVETTTTDPLSGRTIVTNLRLPGQYDERLLGSVGLQGPYYNWNRWYLPGVGRYLELDPIALGGGLNGRGAPDWYNYALGNPLRFTDPSGEAAAAIPIIFAGAAALVAAWETYVVQCTAAGTCPWSPKRCDAGPVPRPEPQPVPLPRNPPAAGCPPCPPPPPSRIDWVPPARPHWPCPGTHAHTFVMDQNPVTCECYPREDRVICM